MFIKEGGMMIKKRMIFRDDVLNDPMKPVKHKNKEGFEVGGLTLLFGKEKKESNKKLINWACVALGIEHVHYKKKKK
jgi:hypothetical protein